MPGINFKAMPKHIMKTIRIHPLKGNVCQMVVFSGWAEISAEYLSTILLNISLNPTKTNSVISNNHQSLFKGIML